MDPKIQENITAIVLTAGGFLQAHPFHKARKQHFVIFIIHMTYSLKCDVWIACWKSCYILIKIFGNVIMFGYGEKRLI